MCIGGGGGGSSKVEQPDPTPQEHALAEVGAKEFNRYVDRFVPATADFLDATSASEGDRLSLASAISGEVGRQTLGRGVDSGTVSGGLRAGLAPTSGRTVFGIDDSSRAYASGVAGGVSAIRPQLLGREVAGLRKVVATGRGLADASAAGLSAAGRGALVDAAARAESAFADKRANLGLRQGLVSGLATAGGFAAGQYGGTLTDAANQAHVLSGLRYGTNPLSQQSLMLAEQERGLF